MRRIEAAGPYATPYCDRTARAGDVTLADLVAAVIDAADDARIVTTVVVAMLESGAIRLRRSEACEP